MKKLGVLVKPYLSIIFGALLFLIYLNFLQMRGTTLAIGIIAVILSAYYLVVGILGVVLGEKMGPSGRKVIDIISLSLFPVFMFVLFLLQVINNADVMGPTGWVIAILSMVGCLAFAVFYIIHRCASSKVVTRLTYLFASIFALILLLNVLFDLTGAPYAIDNIVIVLVILYIVFAYMLFNSLGKMEESSAPKQEEPQEKTKEVDVE